MIGLAQHREVNERLNGALDRSRQLIAVHRGLGGGGIVENTSGAVAAALLSGADIVEIDVVRSTDGHYFVFHDGYEMRHLGTTWRLPRLTAEQIESLAYGAQLALPRPRVERLERVLTAFPDAIFNVDRSWRYWPGLLGWLDRLDMAQRILLKAPPQAVVLEQLREHGVKYPYMAIVRTLAELEALVADADLNLVGVELIARDAESPFCDPELIARLRARGLFVYVNAIDLGNGVPLMAGWDDTVSITRGPADGWGRLVGLGVDVIQTDWPSLLRDYLRELPGSRR